MSSVENTQYLFFGLILLYFYIFTLLLVSIVFLDIYSIVGFYCVSDIYSIVGFYCVSDTIWEP